MNVELLIFHSLSIVRIKIFDIEKLSTNGFLFERRN